MNKPRMKETPPSLFVTLIGYTVSILAIIFVLIPLSIVSMVFGLWKPTVAPTPLKSEKET